MRRRGARFSGRLGKPCCGIPILIPGNGHFLGCIKKIAPSSQGWLATDMVIAADAMMAFQPWIELRLAEPLKRYTPN